MDTLREGTFRLAILTGAGCGFCAGADLSGTGQPWTKPAAAPFKTNYDAQVRLADQLTRLDEVPIPVIAAVNGARVARELMLTGRIIDEDEAYRINLVQEVVGPEQLLNAALEMARSIVANNA